MNDHTPAPWTAHPGNTKLSIDYWVVEDRNGQNIAVCDKNNAHLIAAAPDLLEAVQRLLAHDWWDGSWRDVNFARAVIAKATGATP